MNAHVDEVVAWKRANPADDLLTALIAAEDDGDRLSSRELRDQVNLLFVAGPRDHRQPDRHGYLRAAAHTPSSSLCCATTRRST